MDTTSSESGPLPQTVLRSLLEAALSAPSGDNCQPWKIVLRPTGFDVRFEPERAEAILDVDGLASRMALGALLENALIFARAHGFSVRWLLDPEPRDPRLQARVMIEGVEPSAEDLAPTLPERHTNRHPYATTPLLSQETALLEAESIEPARIQLLTDRPRIEAFATLVEVADRTRAETKRAHEDLHRWLRWTPEEVRSTRDGLDVATLGLGIPERLVLSTLRPWSRARVANALGGSKTTGEYGKKLAMKSGAIGVISVPDLTPATAVAAGRAMERVWLRATKLGLGFSPLATLPLLGLRAEALGGDGLSAHHTEKLRGAYADLRLLVGARPGQHVLFAFRVGHNPPPAVRALRRSLDSVVTPSPALPR